MTLKFILPRPLLQLQALIHISPLHHLIGPSNSVCLKLNQQSPSTLNLPGYLCPHLNREHQHPPSCSARHPSCRSGPSLTSPLHPSPNVQPTFFSVKECAFGSPGRMFPSPSIVSRLAFYPLTLHQHRPYKLSPLTQCLCPPITSPSKNTNARTFFLKSLMTPTALRITANAFVSLIILWCDLTSSTPTTSPLTFPLSHDGTPPRILEFPGLLHNSRGSTNT